jgi:hypothetical protein
MEDSDDIENFSCVLWVVQRETSSLRDLKYKVLDR